MPKQPSVEPNPMRSAERLLLVLRAFRSEAPRRTASEIATELSLAATTVRRLLETLERNGFLHLDRSTGRYALSAEFVRLGGVALSGIDLVRDARPVLEALEASTGESVQLTVLDSIYAVVVDSRQGRALFRYFHGAGHRYLAYGGSAAGKALLAGLDDGEARALLPPEGWKTNTGRGASTPDAFLAVLRDVRRMGYALNDAETAPDVWAVAAPVRDHRGGVIAAVNLPCLAPRLDAAERERRVREVTAAAARLSSAMLYVT